jgi:hypothetical protein
MEKTVKYIKYDHRITRDHPMIEKFKTAFFEPHENPNADNSTTSTSCGKQIGEFSKEFQVTTQMIYRKVGFESWDLEGESSLYNRVERFNASSPEYKVYVGSFSDSEVDEDRLYDSSYSIGICKESELIELLNYKSL